ncbi:EamA family transporter RarD [Stutzerimonas kirkiae]|uniref:EamA family transporter RarD n=1 Tax=Stutzerimonas kirkiae TaxID=2211392 RepID=A0A4Q9R128_9GAMM|nr:EamA family transporter RarD [Stutzerimonas kirkiae]TBU92634.1 EamA family transporter RarD [Stutzerimonas kirkiae]TBV00826.1 EamA family transporter RarD [Stutzerimonas kirkiae]TBV08717.1 EamA family transporter RarD [Stutzerimonas kirkiae]TBV11499.1 EamA family transporter RarD [Stutzerimonas kirkiae]
MSDLRKGYLLALATFTLWGLFPFYFRTLESFSALEIIAQRAIWSALFGALVLLFWRHPGWWRELAAHPRRFAVLVISGLLVAGNWLIYVWAVNNGHIIEISLGYYINPLVNVLLGMLVLRERLRPLQWAAVLLAAAGVGLQLLMLGQLPWIALLLAFSFSLYGLLRKMAPVAALPGLVVETWLLLPVALGWLLLFGSGPSTEAVFWHGPQALWLIAAGPVTIIPLLCFNSAARYLPYSTLGFMQYIAPTLLLVFAVWVFDEAFPADRQLAFFFIWSGLAIYSYDIWRWLRRGSDKALR